MEITIANEKMLLLPERAIYLFNHHTLLLSDIHLGKAGHFRKHGIPISKKIHNTDLAILEMLIKRHKPESVILLGDLFHSYENNEWNDFLRFIEVYDFVNFTLVEGNHDILTNYPTSLSVIPYLELGPFSLTHIKADSGKYNLSGHIHPGVSVKGKGRQSITLPCFYFTDDFGILPAFGQFTGIKKIRPKKNDLVYGIADNQVIELT